MKKQLNGMMAKRMVSLLHERYIRHYANRKCHLLTGFSTHPSIHIFIDLRAQQKTMNLIAARNENVSLSL